MISKVTIHSIGGERNMVYQHGYWFLCIMYPSSLRFIEQYLCQANILSIFSRRFFQLIHVWCIYLLQLTTKLFKLTHWRGQKTHLSLSEIYSGIPKLPRMHHLSSCFPQQTPCQNMFPGLAWFPFMLGSQMTFFFFCNLVATFNPTRPVGINTLVRLRTSSQA